MSKIRRESRTELSQKIIGIAAIAIAAGLLLLGGRVVPASASSYQVVYSFLGGNDGSGPSSPLLASKSGVLYGTTGGAGIADAGTVFQLSPPASAGDPWTEAPIWEFVHGSGDPVGSLVSDSNGVIYGEYTLGSGALYSLTPPATADASWTETTLHTFPAAPGDGEGPNAGLISIGGNLYGTTNLGGAAGKGSAFSYSAAASESVIYSFLGISDGAGPRGPLLKGNGVLYGTTNIGGADNAGTVFQLNPPAAGNPWTETQLYQFTGGADGGFPAQNLTHDNNGVLYGIVYGIGPHCLSQLCGAIFSLTPPATVGGAWTEAVIFVFQGASTGAVPTALLYVSGKLYGVAEYGGGPAGAGVAFALTPPSVAGDPWTETILHRFKGGTDGAEPVSLVMANNALFGATLTGGGTGSACPISISGCGTIFKLVP